MWVSDTFKIKEKINLQFPVGYTFGSNYSLIVLLELE
jgi:hypothetical protein